MATRAKFRSADVFLPRGGCPDAPNARPPLKSPRVRPRDLDIARTATFRSPVPPWARRRNDCSTRNYHLSKLGSFYDPRILITPFPGKRRSYKHTCKTRFKSAQYQGSL